MDNFEGKAKRRYSERRVGPRRPSDLIVRKANDVNGPGEGQPKAEIIRSEAGPVPASSAALMSSQPFGPGQGTQTGPSPIELLLSILRFKWTILAVFIVVAAPMIGAIWTEIAPEYLAKGEIQIRPIIPRLVFNTEDNGAIPFYEGFVNTQVAVMRSVNLLQRVLDQPDVQATQWYKTPKQSALQRLRGQPDTPLERLGDALAAMPRRRTEIIDVTFVDRSARDAAIILNAVLDQYIQYAGESSGTTADELSRQLIEQYTKLQDEIDGIETVCSVFRESLGTATPDQLILARRIRLDEALARLDSVKYTIASLESEMPEPNGDDISVVNVDATESIDSQPEYYQDVEWRVLNTNVRTLRHQTATSLLTPRHPDMVQMISNLEFAEESLRLHEARLDDEWHNRRETVPGIPLAALGTGAAGPPEGSVSIETQLALAKREEKRAKAEYDKQDGEFRSLFLTAQELEKETARLQHKRDLFEAVREQKDQKEIESGVPGSIRVLNKSSIPSKPHSDHRVVFTAMALFMGLGMGGGVAFLRASKNQTIYAPQDMPPTMQAPFLGYIPITRVRASFSKSLHEEVQRNQHNKIESVRLVRTALLSRLNGRGHATILVTSATEGTGKSTFTMTLGESLAHAGKKVLMIDADFRRMTLSKRFGISNKSGFMESLRCKSVDRRQIFATDTPGLSIMPAGSPNENGAAFEETANGAFKACIDQLRRHFDIVLLDSSPMLPVADATILSSQVDGTIMVERELVSHRGNVVDALARLDSAGGRLMGTVFFGSSPGRNYGSCYGYGYGSSKTRYQ